MSSAASALASDLCVSAPARTRGSAWSIRSERAGAVQTQARGIMPGSFDRAR